MPKIRIYYVYYRVGYIGKDCKSSNKTEMPLLQSETR